MINRSLLPACALALLIACTSLHAADEAPATQINFKTDTSWSLQHPQATHVSFQGVANLDHVKAGDNRMLYPAPDAGTFLATVAIHGVFSKGATNRQKEQAQRTADEVLVPYRKVLDSFTHKELLENSLTHLRARPPAKILEAGHSDAGWWMASNPVFFLTRDRLAIVLEHTVALYAPGTLTPVYQNTVKVVGQPREAGHHTSDWLANEGAELKQESATLFARSVDMVLGEMAQPKLPAAASQKTFRYMEGGAERMERGQLLSQACGHVVIKTLRNWLMSIPVNNSNAETKNGEGCA